VIDFETIFEKIVLRVNFKMSAVEMNGTVLFGAKDWVYVKPAKFSPFFFELIDLVWWQDVMITYWKVPFYVCVIYLFTIFGIRRFMHDRKPMELRSVLFFWNFTMALINAMGFFRQIQELIPILGKPHGIHNSLCVR